MPWSARPVAFIASLVVMLCAGMAAASDLPRIGVQHQTGESPGFEENFTRVQAFVPLYGEEQQWLVFGDLLGAVDNLGAPSTSAGLGFRFAPGEGGRVFGIHTHYDYREFEFAHGDHGFHRWGLGAEAIGDLWAARANVYVNASGRRSTGTLFQPDVRYLDRFLQIGTAQNGFAEQPHGVDYEISRLLLRPFGMPVDHEIGLGGYYWDTPRGDGNHATGVKGRIHTWLSDSLLTYVQATHDRVFENSVNAGFIWYFGGPSTRPSARAASLAARMATPIQRQYELPVLQYVEEGAVFATDPATGQRITLTHVDDDAAAGGTGSWEQPFSRLEAASLSGTDIVLVQNGTYPGDSITLSFGQRLLAVNQPHFIETAELGTMLLPGTGAGGTSTILNSPSNSIVLSSETEVAGFTITGAGNNGILGIGVQNVLLRSNTATASGENGVALVDIGGTAKIDANEFSNNTSHGLLVTATETKLRLARNAAHNNNLAGMKIEADVLTGHFYGNRATENMSGIELRAHSRATVEVRQNAATNNSTNGITVLAPTFNGSISENLASDNGVRGIFMFGQITGDISGNTASRNSFEGIIQSGGRFKGSVVGNVADDNADFGIYINTPALLGSVAENTTNRNWSGGIAVLTSDPGYSIGGDLINNTANQNGFNGISVRHSDTAGGVGGRVSGNAAHGNDLVGIAVIGGDDSGIGGSVSQNQANNNGVRFLPQPGSGIHISIGRGIDGDVVSNTADGNRDSGIMLDVFGAGADFGGNILGNITTDNRDGFSFFVADDFSGTFTGNTSNSNVRYGFDTLAGGTVSGTTTGNAASGNGLADFNGNIAEP